MLFAESSRESHRLRDYGLSAPLDHTGYIGGQCNCVLASKGQKRRKVKAVDTYKDRNSQIDRIANDGDQTFALGHTLAEFVHNEHGRAGQALLNHGDRLLKRARVECAASCEVATILTDLNAGTPRAMPRR